MTRRIVGQARVLVAGDNALMRQGLKALLGSCGWMTVVESTDERNFDLHLGTDDLDLVLLVRVDDARPLVPKLLTRSRRKPRLIVLVPAAKDPGSSYATQLPDALTWVRRLPITASPTDVITAVRESLGQVEEDLPRTLPRRRTHARFTPKEDQVFRLLLRGLSNRDIAQELWVTEEPVKAHLTSVYRKLGVKSRAEAIAAHFDASSSSPSGPLFGPSATTKVFGTAVAGA